MRCSPFRSCPRFRKSLPLALLFIVGVGACAQGLPAAAPSVPGEEGFDRAFEVTFSGPKGRDGLDGRTGSSGSVGRGGSVDPRHRKAGGNGGAGGRGSNGEHGGRGGDGPDVKVEVGMVEGQRPLLRIRLEAAGDVKWVRVDPQGGSLTIRSQGGRGGRGGRGGAGGPGGRGGAGSPSGHAGSTGLRGLDGHAGPSGRDGTLTVIVDPKAKPYLGTLRLGPTAVIREAPMAFP